MSKDNIYVRLTGGLGNQMFQYASSFSLAKRLNGELKIDTSFYDSQNLRNFELNKIFNLTYKELRLASGQFPGSTTPGIRRILRRLNSILPLKKRQIYEEPGFGYHSDFFQLSLPVLLIGYWQSPKYFENIRAEIINEFKFQRPLESQLLPVLDKIKSSLSISIHVRRGDYVTNISANQVHGLCSPQYYTNALELLKETLGKRELSLFVFSDDIDWCKQNLKFEQETIFVNNFPNKNTESDMILMSNCKHNIIANSSYSWWGAWLNQNPAKTVIAPKKWFNKSSLNITDIYPKDWTLY